MQRWYRVFGAIDEELAPAAILQFIENFAGVTGKFGGDDAGWYYADLVVANSTPFRIDRYRSDEAGIRAELNSWAAWAESAGADPALMERFIQTRQLFTFRAGDALLEEICIHLARHLATITAGLYQIDGEGLFTAAGEKLLGE